MFSLYQLTSWSEKKNSSFYHPIAVAVVWLEESKWPHFGLIYDLPKEEASGKRLGGVWSPLRMFLGEHTDEQKWDWEEWWPENKSLLLVPKRYLILTLGFFVFFIYLIPRKISIE